MELLLFLLGGLGITTIITKSTIFAPLRTYLDNGGATVKDNFLGLLIVCPMCVGFWIGVFLSGLLYSPAYTTFGGDMTEIHRFLLYFIIDGAILSIFSWGLHMLFNLMDKVYDFLDTKDLYYQFMMADIEANNKDKKIVL